MDVSTIIAIRRTVKPGDVVVIGVNGVFGGRMAEIAERCGATVVRVEAPVRYGHAARTQYADHNDWDDKLEGKLRTEWDDLKSGRTWDEVKAHVRHGWDSARRKV